MKIFDLLLPDRCVSCERVGPSACLQCRRRLREPCLAAAPSGIDQLWSLFSYEGVGKAVVGGLKYRNRRCMGWMIDELVPVIEGRFDCITWVPSSKAGRRRRGFDVAEVMARGLARQLDVAPRRLLMRLDRHQQTQTHGSERLQGPRLRVAGLVPSTVLVVDDVITSGATLGAAAQVLRSAGARRIGAATLARTPRAWS